MNVLSQSLLFIRNQSKFLIGTFIVLAFFAMAPQAYATISGSVLSESSPGKFNVAEGAGHTVRLLVNGVDSTLSDVTDASGDYSINNGAIENLIDVGDILTVYLDDTTIDGVTVTYAAVADGSITDLDIFTDTVIARSEDSGTSITNAHLNTGNSGDSDIATIYSYTTQLEIEPNMNMYIWYSNTTYEPVDDVQVGGSLFVSGGYTGGAETVTFQNPLSVINQFDPGSGNTYPDIVIDGITVVELYAGDLAVTNLTNNATLDLDGNNLTVTSTHNYDSDALFRAHATETVSLPAAVNAGHWYFYGDDDGTSEVQTIPTGLTLFEDVTIWDFATGFVGSDDFEFTVPVTITGDLGVNQGTLFVNAPTLDVGGQVFMSATVIGYLEAGSSTITVGGDWRQEHASAFTPGTSTVIFTDTANSIIGSQNFAAFSIPFCNLEFRDDTSDATPSNISVDYGQELTVQTGCTLTVDGSNDGVSIDSTRPGIVGFINVVDGAGAVTATNVAVLDNYLLDNGVIMSPEYDPVGGTDNGNAEGWFAPSASSDADGDGNSNTIENAAPNSGDGNADTFQDSLQSAVTSTLNPVTGGYVTLQLNNTGLCEFITGNQLLAESALAVQDSEADYPVGLFDFSIECDTNGASVELTQYLDQYYGDETDDWVYKKYNASNVGNEYEDISDLVTYGTANIGGTTVTTIVYTVTDGDARTDTDGSANGIIIDPSGPSIFAALGLTGGGGSSTIRRVCKDPKATNYDPNAFGRHTSSLCEYTDFENIIVQLTNQLNEKVEAPEDTCSSYTFQQNLRRGDRDGQYSEWQKSNVSEIKLLQAYMNRIGFNSGPVDGSFGPRSEAAVKQMQSYFGADNDGMVGPQTRSFINASCQERVV